MNLLCLANNFLSALTVSALLALQILLFSLPRLAKNYGPKFYIYRNFLLGPSCAIIVSNFSLERPKPEPNLFERGLVCLLSATISGIMLSIFWQHTELFRNLIHASNHDLLNRSLADVLWSVAYSLPIILAQEIYFYQRQRKGQWQSLLFDKNVWIDTFIISSCLFWALPILLISLVNGMDACATSCLVNCSIFSLMAMELAMLIAGANRYKLISGIDSFSLKKYCHLLEDDNFSCAALDAMTPAQLLDLTNVAVKTGDFEKADIISSYHFDSVAGDFSLQKEIRL